MRVMAMDSEFGVAVRRSRLTARMLCAVLVMWSMLFVTVGCTTESTKAVVQDIANALPTVQADVNIAAQIAETLEPGVAPVIVGVTATVDAALVQLQVLCTTYAQTQDATVLASINTTLNTMLNTSAAGLLDAAKIVDPVSRAKALQYLGLLQTALQLVYSIYQKIQTKAQVKATAAMRTYKLRDVAPYLDQLQVAEATGVPFDVALHFEQAQGF